MGEIRSGGSIPTPQPNFQNPEVVSADVSPMKEGVGQPKEDIVPRSKDEPEAVKAENATQMKTEKNVAGAQKQTELNKKLAAGKTTIKEFPPNAGNDQLGPIGLNRQNLDGESITQFPNGVRIRRYESPATHSADIRSGSGHPTVQKAGSNIAFDVVPPPGGKVEVTKDGEIAVKDSKGQAVAFVDSEGNMSTKTKQGDYRQSSDGKIRFTQNGDTKPESLRKPGEINPKDFENYGITTDGKTIRFPNGVEYDRSSSGVRVPKEIGHAIRESVGNSKLDLEMGYGLDGSPLYEGDGPRKPGSGQQTGPDRGSYVVITPDGTFDISPEGKISYQPRK